MELATQVASGIHASDTDLCTNVGSMRVLSEWTLPMSSMVGSPMSQSPMFMIVLRENDTRCKNTKPMPESTVKEFQMSREHDDFHFVDVDIQRNTENLCWVNSNRCNFNHVHICHTKLTVQTTFQRTHD